MNSSRNKITSFGDRACPALDAGITSHRNYTAAFVFQKINYIHNNPVEAGIVKKPEHFLYSRAKDY